MMEIVIEVLDEEGLKFAAAIRSLGLASNEAAMIAYLLDAEAATSREIEVGTGLRQPEVSIGMKALRSRDWIREREIRSERKGRPMKVYALKATVGEIVRQLEREQSRDGAKNIASAQELAVPHA
ncbi:MAG TPA: ArsR family transcriptional regulator [Methanotrichaceae archaeon]|nr:ArsR family transcriptional regulator [Methanotrichaceae archaeon]